MDRTARGLSVASLIASAVALMSKRVQAAPGAEVYLDEATEKLLMAIAQATGETLESVRTILSTPIANRELLNFRAAVPAASMVRLSDNPTLNGKIVQVEVHFPDGCNALVNVAVYKDSDKFLPRDDFLALNDVTRPYYLNLPIKKTDTIIVEIWNGDGLNPHTISVIILIEEMKA